MKVPKTVMNSLFLLAFLLFSSTAMAQQSPAPSLTEPQPRGQQPQQDERPWLGVTIQEVNEKLARQMGIADPSGVLVADIAQGSPADDAGINLGDIIVRLNGRDVEDSSDFIARIQDAGVGATIALEVNRGGTTEEINVTLEPMPMEPMSGRFMPGGMGQGMLAMGGPDQCPSHGQHDMGAAPCPMGHDCPMGQNCPGKSGMCQQCPMGEACPGHQMGMMHGGKGMMGGQMMGRMGEKMGMTGYPMYGKIMMAIKSLNLTPDQKAKAQALHSDYKKRQIRAKAEAKVAHIELHELLAADQVNMDKVKAKVNELAQKRAEMMLSGIRALEDFKKLLTPEQKKSFREQLAMDSGAAEDMEEMESAEAGQGE